MTNPNRTTKSALIRAPLPREVHRRLKHLAADSDTSVQALLVEASILLLRYHGRAYLLPQPMPPCPPVTPEMRPVKKGGKA